jgi:hypothetical protein
MKLLAALVALNVAFLVSIAVPPSPDQAAARLAAAAARSAAAAQVRQAVAAGPEAPHLVRADAPAPGRS